MSHSLKSTIANQAASENDPRWQAVINRDASQDGQFIYAVKSTGIYCRPSCPSKNAKRQNVCFFNSSAQAEAAGFRPCLRCRPDTSSIQENNAAAIAQACRIIETSEELPILDQLAAKVGLSAFHFHRQFKAITGLTPKAYGTAYRAQRMREELIDSDNSVTEAIYAAGFNSSSRFYEKSNEVLGMSPTKFKNGGKDTIIHFAIGECSLGSILVARSDKGVCAITIGDDPELLARDLQDRFPQANLIGADADFEAIVAKVVGLIEAPQLGLDLPLDMRGTAFQQRVWQALQKIPAGSTVSYTQLAQMIGQPTAARAVALACGANKLAVAIPCHRVVRTDGAISGYRWGVERKRILLEREAAG